MVSTSPRMRDSLDYEDPEEVDPRLSFGFRSMSLESSGYDNLEDPNDERPFSANSHPSKRRKKKRQRRSDISFEHLTPFQYQTVADGDLFRLVVIYPGTGTETVTGRLIWESSKNPRYDYSCLSYCWETTVRDEFMICDGYRFPITKNLLSALQSLRNRTTNLLIWVDQICINQDDDNERGHQVSIMKKIFNLAKEVCVWLGDEDDKVHKLFEYAKRMRRGDDSAKIKSSMDRILAPRHLQLAVQRLLQRHWFQRVWVIPEVALARFTVVACGRSRISWDNLVRLVRDCQPPRQATGFDKQADILGNPRQRIAIITQMIASQREALLHTDITQLLILAKASKATDVRDKIYAFYGVTLLTTFPNYTRSIEMLYADIVHMYVNSIKWETYYSSWHNLSEEQKNFQLMSILYSAGALHQHHTLPSWIPDWTFAWHLAPVWCKTTSNIVTGSGKDEWSTGVRSDFRAGGEERGTFEIIDDAYGMHQLKISVIVLDSITSISENTPASTPGLKEESPLVADLVESPTLRYGRMSFNTVKGYAGIATPGIEVGDWVAVLLGGDVPVILRPFGTHDEDSRAYKLLCECFIQSQAIMHGDQASLARANWPLQEDIVLI